MIWVFDSGLFPFSFSKGLSDDWGLHGKKWSFDLSWFSDKKPGILPSTFLTTMVLGHVLLITGLLLGESATSEIRKMVPCDGWTPMRLAPGITVRSIFACSSKCQRSPMCSSFQYLGRICRLEDFTLPESARVNVTEGCFRSKFVFIFFFNLSVFLQRK